MLSDKIGAGITIGAKTTINTPDGSRVVAAGIKLVDEGVALGFQTEKDGKVSDYAATFDNAALAQLVFAVGYFVRRTLGKGSTSSPGPAPTSGSASGIEGEEKGYVQF